MLLQEYRGQRVWGRFEKNLDAGRHGLCCWAEAWAPDWPSLLTSAAIFWGCVSAHESTVARNEEPWVTEFPVTPHHEQAWLTDNSKLIMFAKVMLLTRSCSKQYSFPQKCWGPPIPSNCERNAFSKSHLRPAYDLVENMSLSMRLDDPLLRMLVSLLYRAGAWYVFHMFGTPCVMWEQLCLSHQSTLIEVSPWSCLNMLPSPIIHLLSWCAPGKSVYPLTQKHYFWRIILKQLVCRNYKFHR